MTDTTDISTPPRPRATAFTARQIAARSVCDPKTVSRRLEGIPAVQFLDIEHAGRPVPAWTIAALPPAIREELARRARKCGHRTIEDYMQDSSARWQPSVALRECCDADLDHAVRMQRALLPLITDERADVKASEFEALGVKLHAEAFDLVNPISERHWRRLFRIVVDRIGGHDDIERLDYYLPARQTRREEPAAVVTAATEAIYDLDSAIRGCRDPLNPSLPEWELIKRRVCEHFEGLRFRGLTQKQAMRQLGEQLAEKPPFVRLSRDGIRKKIGRWLEKFDEHEGAPEAFVDGREKNTGNRDGYSFPEADFNQMVGVAVYRHDGDIAAAWRELWYTKAFTPATMEHFGKWQRSRKSDVPKSVMEAVRFPVQVLCKWKLGERGYNSMRARVNLSAAPLSPMMVISGDDLTPDCYYGVEVAPGKDRMVRGQILLFIDFATLRIIGYVISPAPSYNSLMILGEMTRIFRDIGVPAGVQFEKNIWEAHIVQGRSKTAPSLSQTERESRFEQMGIKFTYTTSPQGKARTERVIRFVQEAFRAEPGSCGSDEKVTCPEETRRRIERVNRGELRARDAGFHDLASFGARFAEICRTYNATAQEGKILNGLSPDAAFEQFFDPEFLPTKFTPELEHLLTYHDEEVKVTINGIRLPFGKGVYYKDETMNLNRYQGQTVKVHLPILEWSENGLPDRLIVSHGKDHFPVYRETIVSPVEWLFDPNYPGLKQAKRENAACEADLKRLLKELKPIFNTLPPAKRLPTRRTIADSNTHRKGAALTDAQTKGERKRDLGGRLATVLGGMDAATEADLVEEGNRFVRANARADRNEAEARERNREQAAVNTAAILAELDEREARLKAQGLLD